ncbi:hypothetical protein ACXHPV_18000, partial [Vibrio cincinnatiensis]
ALSSINGKSFIASSLVNRIAMIDSLVSLKLVVIRFFIEVIDWIICQYLTYIIIFLLFIDIKFLVLLII